MTFEVDLLFILEITIIVLSLKLILGRWEPPVQQSLQAIISISLGTIVGAFFNPTKDGFIIGIVTSCIAFYGRDLLLELSTLKQDLQLSDINLMEKKNNKDIKK